MPGGRLEWGRGPVTRVLLGVAGSLFPLYAPRLGWLAQVTVLRQSVFMFSVVVGGVGNIWGTLLGATLIGFLQKGIEWFIVLKSVA